MDLENSLTSPRPGPSVALTGSEKKIRRRSHATYHIRDPLLVARVNKVGLTFHGFTSFADVWC